MRRRILKVQGLLTLENGRNLLRLILPSPTMKTHEYEIIFREINLYQMDTLVTTLHT